MDILMGIKIMDMIDLPKMEVIKVSILMIGEIDLSILMMTCVVDNH